MTQQATVADDPVQAGRGSKGSPSRQPQIQALRAIAVLSVVLYHFWPARLAGGYVGVDVFFVISGYLMTKSILHIRADQNGQFRSTMREFYSRRVARILPAALLTLLICAVLVPAVLSTVAWPSNLRDILAAAFFVENWMLAANATDYLGSTTGSAVQHFWSLSVEEQFYAVWPVIVFFAAKVVPRLTARARTARLLAVFGTLTAISLIYSIHATAVDSGTAYFSTGTRFWELSFGGLAFIVDQHISIRHGARAAAGWAGLALIGYTLITFNSITPFPSWRALLPVTGAALVILGAPAASMWGPTRLLSARPLQWIGDISYSIYLIHWPLLVLFTEVVADGAPLNRPVKLTLIPVTFGLAWVMKRQIEDRFRRSNGSGRSNASATPDSALGRTGPASRRRGLPLRRTLQAIATLQVAVVAIGVGGLWYDNSLIHRAEASVQAFSNAGAAQKACYAAISKQEASRFCPQTTDSVLSVVPSPLVAKDDWPYGHCQERVAGSSGERCVLVKGTGPQIVIAGDSHMTQWIPAILPWAVRHKFSVTTFLKSGCPLTDPSMRLQSCADWNKNVLSLITKLRPHYILTSAMSAPNDRQVDLLSHSLVAPWRQLSDNGSRIIAFLDIPQPSIAGLSIPSCVTTKKSFSACRFSKQQGLSRDIVQAAARQVPGAQTIDLSSMFCPRSRCEPEIDGILVWIDGGHMSSYFARGLSDALAVKLDAAISAS